MRMKLSEWQQLRKPREELLYNCSEYSAKNDEWVPFPIGMSWQLLEYQKELTLIQLGPHDQTVLCALGLGTDRRRRPAFNRDHIVQILEWNGITNQYSAANNYLESLPQYKFVISPEGNGIDCHRHYEALMAGAIPVVEDHPGIREKYAGCPILYTKDYSEITPAYLDAKYEEMKEQVYDFSRLFLSFYDERTRAQIIDNGNYWSHHLRGKLWYVESQNVNRMNITVGLCGRFCNHVFRNLFASFLAEKGEVKFHYSFLKEITELGIPLYTAGTQVYAKEAFIPNEHFMRCLEGPVDYNFSMINCYAQDPDFARYVHAWFRTPLVQSSLIAANRHKEKYNANKDVFVHVRLDDASAWNPGFAYYSKAIVESGATSGYISSDSPDHPIVQGLMAKHNLRLVEADEVETLMLASTCRHIVLSHGTFSWMMGALGFFSTVYIAPKPTVAWCGDIFVIPEWKIITP
jgi:hypothetical protein